MLHVLYSHLILSMEDLFNFIIDCGKDGLLSVMAVPNSDLSVLSLCTSLTSKTSALF